MKKIYFLAFLLFTCANTICGQTYYYKIINKVNTETGVKEPAYGDFYLTFTKNQTVCYQSDKNGNLIPELNRRSELGQKRGVIGVPVRGYNGMPMTGGCWMQSDGVFKYSGTINDMYEFKCYYYADYGPAQGDPVNGYYYIYLSKNLNRINLGRGGTVVVAERQTMPGETAAPTQMY